MPHRSPPPSRPGQPGDHIWFAQPVWPLHLHNVVEGHRHAVMPRRTRLFSGPPLLTAWLWGPPATVAAPPAPLPAARPLAAPCLFLSRQPPPTNLRTRGPVQQPAQQPPILFVRRRPRRGRPPRAGASRRLHKRVTCLPRSVAGVLLQIAPARRRPSGQGSSPPPVAKALANSATGSTPVAAQHVLAAVFVTGAATLPIIRGDSLCRQRAPARPRNKQGGAGAAHHRAFGVRCSSSGRAEGGGAEMQARGRFISLLRAQR